MEHRQPPQHGVIVPGKADFHFDCDSPIGFFRENSTIRVPDLELHSTDWGFTFRSVETGNRETVQCKRCALIKSMCVSTNAHANVRIDCVRTNAIILTFFFRPRTLLPYRQIPVPGTVAGSGGCESIRFPFNNLNSNCVEPFLLHLPYSIDYHRRVGATRGWIDLTFWFCLFLFLGNILIQRFPMTDTSGTH